MYKKYTLIEATNIKYIISHWTAMNFFYQPFLLTYKLYFEHSWYKPTLVLFYLYIKCDVIEESNVQKVHISTTLKNHHLTAYSNYINDY